MFGFADEAQVLVEADRSSPNECLDAIEITVPRGVTVIVDKSSGTRFAWTTATE